MDKKRTARKLDVIVSLLGRERPIGYTDYNDCVDKITDNPLEVIDMLCDALATFPAYKLMEIDLDAIPEWKVFDEDERR